MNSYSNEKYDQGKKELGSIRSKVRFNRRIQPHKIRDAHIKDVTSIKALILLESVDFFGQFDVNAILSEGESVYSFVIEEEISKAYIVAFAHFFHSPNVSAVPNECWLEWIQHHYCMPEDMTYGSVLFLNYLLFDIHKNPMILSKLFEEVFLREPKLKFICTVAPSPIEYGYDNAIYHDVMELFATQKLPHRVKGANPKACQTVYVTERKKFLPNMRFRQALPEDNDDIVEIVDLEHPYIREQLGEYYIAQEVLEEDQTKCIIVAEISNVTIGMIWVNTNVDVLFLMKNFELLHHGHLARLQRKGQYKDHDVVVRDLVRNESTNFFSKLCPKNFKVDAQEGTRVYYPSSDVHFKESEEHGHDDEILFQKWKNLTEMLNDVRNYTKHIKKTLQIVSEESGNQRILPLEEKNVFAIELFGLKNGIDGRRIFDLLAAAFSSYRNKDYCVFSLATTERSETTKHLLRYFTRVIPRDGCTITDTVFITHRSCILGEINFTPLTYDDVCEIERLLLCAKQEVLPKKDETALGSSSLLREDGEAKAVMQIMLDVFENPRCNFHFLTVRNRDVTVGFVAVRPVSQMNYLRTKYGVWGIGFNEGDPLATEYLPDYRNGEIILLKIHPLFEWESNFIFREISRLTGYLSFYYLLNYESNRRTLSNSLLQKMCPIAPRPCWSANRESKGCDTGTICKPFALYHQNLKFSQAKLSTNDTRLVVIGFDETCKAFLKSLIFPCSLTFKKNVVFVNITVITKVGEVEAEYDLKNFNCSNPAECWVHKECGVMDAKYLRRLEFRTWVKFVSGCITAIDRTEKRIILDNESSVSYDVLFLMCSTDFGPPVEIKSSTPINYLQINNKLDRILLYNKIAILQSESKLLKSFNIVVYGNHLKAHACVNFLLNHGVEAATIYLVIPTVYPGVFDDDHVEYVVLKNLKSLGILVYENYKFVEWTLCEKGLIKSVLIETDFEQVTINCNTFISYHPRALDASLNLVLQLAGVKVDSEQIVIDATYKTNELCIYAAGKMTKFAKELCAESFEHKYLNQMQIGEELANDFLKMISTPKKFSKYKKPIFQQASIAGNLVFAVVRQPGKYWPRASRQLLHNYGMDLQTFAKDDSESDYCRVHLDNHGFVTEIVCLTKSYNDLEFLTVIYNCHETLLRNMKNRWMQRKIPNLVEFFHEPWAGVILHDKFGFLQNINENAMIECIKDVNKQALVLVTDEEELKQLLKNYLNYKKMQKLLDANVLKFLRLNKPDLQIGIALPEDFTRKLFSV